MNRSETLLRGGRTRIPALLLAAAGAPVWVAGAMLDIAPARPDRLLLVSYVLLQPLVEELAFRGAIQGSLSRTRAGALRMAGAQLATIAAALIFSAYHLRFHGAPWAVATFPPSIALGILRERGGSLVACIAVHGAWNAGWFTAREFAIG